MALKKKKKKKTEEKKTLRASVEREEHHRLYCAITLRVKIKRETNYFV